MTECQILTAIQNDLLLTVEEIEQDLDSNSKLGLDQHEAITRFEDHGVNAPICRRKESEFLKLFKNLIGFHNGPLWIAAVLCFTVYLTEYYFSENDLEVKPDNLYIGAGLVIFVFAFGIFSYYMEAKCEYYLESGREYMSHYATVVRDGMPLEVLKEQLVVGDLISFRPGDEICADIKLVEGSNVHVNVDMLADREKHFYEQIYDSIDRLFSKGDIIFRASFIFSGHGKGIVTRTRHYYLSQSQINNDPVVQENATKRHKLNPLTVEMETALHYLSSIAIAISAIYAVSSVFFGYSWLRSVMFFIALYVGIITEALLPTFNVAKAQIAKELASKNCYIKNIESLETLGTTTIICTNKTGVITQNRMIVGQMWLDNTLHQSYEFIRDFKNTNLAEPYHSFVRACSLCVFSQFSVDDEPDLSPFKRSAIGKPSEVAMMRYMDAFVGGLEEYQEQLQYEKLLEMSFNWHNKCSLKVYALPDKQLLVCIKAEPETLIHSATKTLTSDGVKRFSQSYKSHLLAVCNKLGKEKNRLIAIGQVLIERKAEYLKPNGRLNMSKFNGILDNSEMEIQFLGLVALQNPIRLSVPEAIFKCRRAGVKVIMVTFDHPATALSIAETAGIVLHRRATCLDMEGADETLSCPLVSSYGSSVPLSGLPSNVYTSHDLATMKDSQLRSIISSNNDLVFARISPEDKLRIVNCCRQCRSIVAVTGVSTADVAIFDRSHVRISLGQYGSDITKRNSDIILLDDNFSSIVHGIEYGRVLFENIKKSLCYTLSSKPVELGPYLLYLSLGIPQICSSISIIMIDLFSDNLPPIALGYEGAESHVMKGYPRHMRNDKVINFETILVSIFFYGTIQLISGCFAYVVVMAESGFLLGDLLYTRPVWYSPSVNDFEDSYGQEWTFAQRSELEYLTNSVYFVTVVITRASVLFACRTRRDSCISSLFSNVMVNFSIFLQFVLVGFLSYYSPFQYTIRMYPLKLPWWFLSTPFFVLILCLEELRKWIIRRHPHSAIARLVYY